ncbi:unnamed protein product [Urochloa decumbens]|uniref:F-box domain-containing protein n=1 Tax=Urochloa decumbens TaxID=240449 RepID=A0ABC9H0H9_9POAL
MDLNLMMIDEILILERIDSPVSLVHAASTCKRWHAMIADAGFLRRFRSVHASSLVAGDYFNDRKLFDSIMKRGRGLTDRPSFNPAAAAAAASTPMIDARHFSLDFLSAADGGDSGGGSPIWAILDSRGSLLLLYRISKERPYNGEFPDVAVCEPATRRYKRIPPPPNYFNSHYRSNNGCYLIDGEDDDVAGGRIGMSNFKVLYMFEHTMTPLMGHCTGAATFTACDSAGSPPSWGNWTARLAVASPDGGVAIDDDQDLWGLHNMGRAGGCQYFYAEGRDLIGLDVSTGEFSYSVFSPSWTDDFDVYMWMKSKLCAVDGSDGEPRIFTVFDETMRVYAKPDGGGEWTLEKSLSVPEVARDVLPGYKDEAFQYVVVDTKGPGYVILSLKTALDKWLISVDPVTMEVELVAKDMGSPPVMYPCEIPWPPVLSISM